MKQTASSALHQSSLQQVQAQGQMASSSSASFNQGGAICIFQPDHDYSKRATDEGHPQSIVVVHESNGILSRTLPAQVNVLMVSSAQTNSYRTKNHPMPRLQTRCRHRRIPWGIPHAYSSLAVDVACMTVLYEPA